MAVNAVSTVIDRLVRRNLVVGADLVVLLAVVDAVQAWPVGSHRFGHYAEATDGGTAICRTENVSACVPAIAALVDGPLRRACEQYAGVELVAFKDKINYKQPGGAGFLPHQDQVAYPGVTDVVSILLALDDCTTESGCLYVTDGVDRVLATDDRGVVRPEELADRELVAAELRAGDGVILPGLAPHSSETNRSGAQRRVLVASYAPVTAGYTREHYYDARAAVMAERTADDGRFRISTLADFAGVEVAPEATAVGRCLHD